MAFAYELLVRIGAEIRDYKKGLAEAVQETKNAGKQIAEATKTTDDAQQQLGKGLSTQARAVVDGASKFALLSTGARVAATGIGILAVAAAGYAVAAHLGAQEAERQANALLLTGNAAGLVSGQLNTVARDVANQINGQTANVRSIAETLTATGQVSAQALGAMSGAVALVAQYSGQTREAVTKDFAGMADGVAKWAAKHNEQYHFITYAQYEYIKGLEDAGEKQRAMRETSELLSKHLGGDLTQNLGTLQKLWVSVGKEAKNAWDRFLDIGRQQTAAEKVQQAGEALKAAQTRLETVKRTGQFAGGTGAQDALDKAQLLYDLAVVSEAVESRTAERKEESANQEQAKFRWGSLVEKSQSKQLQLQEAIAKATRTADEAGITDLAQRKQVIDYLTKQYLGSSNGLENQLNAELAVYEGYARERTAILSGAEKSAESLRRQNVLSETQLAAQLHTLRDNALNDQIALAELQAETAAGKKQLAAQKKYLAEVAELQAKRENNDQAHADRLAEIDAAGDRKVSDKIDEWAREAAAAEQTLELEYRLYGKTAEARAVALAGMKLEQEAEKLIADAKKAGAPLSDQQAEALRREAKARGTNASAMTGEAQALAGAQQLREENLRYAAESIVDEDQRARALLEIRADYWRQRIALAGAGTEAEKRLVGEFETWYRDQLDKPAQDRWRATVDRFGTTFREGFTRLLEGGKDKWSSFTSSLRNAFKTEVADQLYRLLAKPFVVNVIANLTGATQAGQAAQVANGLNGASNFLGLGGVGSAFGSSFGAGLNATLSGGLEIFNISLEGGLASIAEGTSTAIASGLGQIAGTIAPYAAAALVAYQVINSLFGSKGGPKTESTYDTGYSSLDRAGSDPATARQLSDSIEAAYQQLATSLGLAVQDLQVGVFTAIDTAGDALTQLQVVARQNGQEIYNRGARLGGDGTGSTPGGIENVGRSEAELQAAIAAEMQQVLLAALQSTDLSAKFKDYLNSATDVSAAVNTVVAIRQLDQAFTNIGGPLAQLTQLSVEAEVAYVNQLGGVQALSAALGSYYQNFYTEGERQQRAVDQLREAFGRLDSSGAFDATRDLYLNLANAPTRENFRALLQAQDLTTESGRATYAALLKLSGAFAEVVPVVESAADAIEQAVQKLTSIDDVFGALDSTIERFVSANELRAYRIGRIQQQLASQGYNVSTEAIGSATADSLRAVLASLDLTTNEGRRAAVALAGVSGAILDLNASAGTAAQGIRSAADILSERRGLEQQLYQALGNTQVLRERELAALDPSNRAYQQHLYAIEDAQAGVEAANTAYQQAQQAAQQAAQAIQGQVSAQQQAVSQLEQDMQRWVNVRKQAGGLLGQIATSLGGPDNREADLWAQISGAASLEDQLSAAQELYGVITQRSQVESQAAQQALGNAQAMLSVGKQLRDYVQGLRTGDLTALTPAQALAEAQAQYQATYSAAAGGDTEAQGRLQSVSDTYLRLAREFDPESYSSVFNAVTSQLESLGGSLQSAGQQQAAAQQALIDAAGTGNELSAEQLAKLGQLQSVVQGLYSQADASATTTNAQLFIANANLTSLQMQLDAANAAAANVASGVDAAKVALVAAQAEAAAYLATHQAEIANTDPVPGLLQSLPANIAAALAPLINSSGSGAGGFDPARAQIIRDYAAALPQDNNGARQLYDAARANGVSAAELDAALGAQAGSSNAWAAANNLPAFARGINYVPEDMLAEVHQGERILPAADNARLFQVLDRSTNAGNDNLTRELLAEVRALRAEVKALREQSVQGDLLNAQATERNTQVLATTITESASRADRTGKVRAQAVAV